ncbi:MAG: dipeptidase [Clostridia bacterium]|nr:dipeptidase [Clostridia bacterium]
MYCDLHCDTLTVCRDGEDADRFTKSVNDLKNSGCKTQCFAIFTENKTEEQFFAYADYFWQEMRSLQDIAEPVLRRGDISRISGEGKLACMLTAENLGFLQGDPRGVYRIAKCGVKMASLVWNTQNAFACPNMIFKNGVPDFALREKRGLTSKGKEAVEIMNSCGIYADVSHLSDGGVKDVLEISSYPVIASHSNAYEVCPVCRNLTDGQIKAIADSGGLAGVNFCRDFLGFDDIFEGVLAHIKHIVNVGGEDCVAFGSDFDGMSAPEGLETCRNMPDLLNYLDCNLGGRLAEKIACGNFMRVFDN